MIQQNDPVCALATPQGMGAIALIRLSGDSCKTLVQKVFSKNITDAKSHTLHFGNFKDEDEVIDEVVLSFFETGKSFTGEESIEITCHGSVYIQQRIIQILLKNGFRMAEPGEFTMRAFANGKLDLSQAEAVGDLISAESKRAAQIALRQMKGGFSNKLSELREKLIGFASMIELELDFGEEDVEFADRTELQQMVEKVIAYIGKLAASFSLGNAIKKGIPVAIVGAPNAGKSTLLNALLDEDRAIVSNVEGTTRDVIEEVLTIGGIQFRFIDTAGIRQSDEEIENLGIERSKQKIDMANIVLILSDLGKERSKEEGHLSMSVEDAIAWKEELETKYTDKHILVLANKKDLFKGEMPEDCLPISAKTGEGLEELKDYLRNELLGNIDFENDIIVSNARHYEALIKTNESLERALEGIKGGVSGDFVAMDIRQAMFDLGTITGEISTEDLLGSIFSNFCIGK